MIGQSGLCLAQEQGELLSTPTEAVLSTLTVVHRPLDVQVAIALSLLHPFPKCQLFILRDEQRAEFISLPAVNPMTDAVPEVG